MKYLKDNMTEIKELPKTGKTDLRLQDLLALCLSHWKWFVISLIFTMSMAVLYILRTPPQYTRTSVILIKDNTNKNDVGTMAANDLGLSLLSGATDVRNELATLKSPELIQQAVARLHLNVRYSVEGRFHDVDLYGKSLPVIVSVQKDDEDESNFGFNLKTDKSGRITLSGFYLGNKKLEAQPVKGSLETPLKTPVGLVTVARSKFYMPNNYDINVSVGSVKIVADKYAGRLKAAQDNDKNAVINLTVTDESPERASDFLNALYDVYNESWVADKNKIAISTSRFINDRLAVIEQELGDVDSDISAYKSEHLIPDIKESSRMYMEKANTAESQLLDLTNSLSVAKYVRSFISNDANKLQLLPTNVGISSPSVENQINSYNERLIDRNNMVQQSSAANPLVVEADMNLAALRTSIITSLDNEINALNTQIRGYRSSEQSSNARIASNPTQAKYLLSVERQQKVKESLYLFLLEKREENELSQAFTAYNTRLISPPNGPLNPTSPRKTNILAIAFVLGLLFPAGIIILRANMDNKVRGRKDLEILSIPFVGELPLLGGKKNIKKEALSQIVVKEHSQNMINEAMRMVRTNLEFMIDPSRKSNVVMLTSLIPNSGKTFTSLNLAASFAVQDTKTIVIDLDMRKSALSQSVGAPRIGISDYLSGRVDDIDSLIMHSDDCPNLEIIPVGTIPPNPAELLLRPRLQQLVDALREKYSMIILDCPPVEVVADASIIAKVADMTIFVVRCGLLDREMLPVIEEYYRNNKFNGMTLMLNGVPLVGNRYGYRYGYSYGYRYGYSYGYGKKSGYYTTH